MDQLKVKPGDAQGYKEWASKTFRADVPLALARKRVGAANFNKLRAKDDSEHELDDQTALALLQEIEVGLFMGSYTLDEIGSGTAEWNELCQRYGHVSFYRYFAVPEAFGSAAGETFVYDVENYHGYQTRVTVKGHLASTDQPYWEITVELLRPDGESEIFSNVQFGMANPLELNTPKSLADSANWMARPFIQLKLMFHGNFSNYIMPANDSDDTVN